MKKVLLKILQNLQENLCVESLFLTKLQVSGLQRWEKTPTHVFLWILQINLRTPSLQNRSGRLLLINVLQTNTKNTDYFSMEHEIFIDVMSKFSDCTGEQGLA